MQVSVFARLVSPNADGRYLRRLGEQADRMGVRTLWVGEHIVTFDEYESVYPASPNGRWTRPMVGGLLSMPSALTYLAAHTERVRLGTGVVILPQANPVYTAKQYATVDFLSAGRLEFGVGVGWSSEEYEACGVPWRDRGARCDEYLQVIHTLWYDEVSAFHGRFYNLPECHCFPQPLSRVPVTIGGLARGPLRRVARFGDAWYGVNQTPDDVRRVREQLAGMLSAVGRELSEVRIIVGTNYEPVSLEQAAALHEAGADELLIPLSAAPNGDGLSEDLGHLAAYLAQDWAEPYAGVGSSDEMG